MYKRQIVNSLVSRYRASNGVFDGVIINLRIIFSCHLLISLISDFVTCQASRAYDRIGWIQVSINFHVVFISIPFSSHNNVYYLTIVVYR